MFFLWICLFIPNVPHSFQPIDVSRIQNFMVQRPFISGGFRKDLARYNLTYRVGGGLINPTLALYQPAPRRKHEANIRKPHPNWQTLETCHLHLASYSGAVRARNSNTTRLGPRFSHHDMWRPNPNRKRFTSNVDPNQRIMVEHLIVCVYQWTKNIWIDNSGS